MCAALSTGGASASAQEAGQPPPAPLPAPLGPDGVLKPGADPADALRSPGDDVRLSNEKTVTRYAHAFQRAAIRSRPSVRARKIARLQYLSGSRAPQIYGLLRGRVDVRGRAWLRVRVPGRPNRRVGWAPASAFYEVTLVRTQLVVNRSTLRATLYRRGRRIWQAPVGVGKASTPTPRGRYFIDRKEGAIFGPFYGPRVLFTTAYSRSQPAWPGGAAVGMHGTSEPQKVPGRPSHGCIRVQNEDISRLARLIPVGTPLLIR